MADCILIGNGGTAIIEEYIIDGLIFKDENIRNDATTSISTTPEIPVTTRNLTMEICCKPTAIPASDGYSRLLQFGHDNFICFALSKKTSDVGQNADYGLNPFAHTGSSDQDVFVKIDDLVFSETHTFSIVLDGNVMKVYFDGSLVNDTLSITEKTNWTVGNIYIMCGSINNRVTTGEWYNTRIYNRVLSISEIAANYAVDVSRYG